MNENAEILTHTIDYARITPGKPYLDWHKRVIMLLAEYLPTFTGGVCQIGILGYWSFS